ARDSLVAALDSRYPASPYTLALRGGDSPAFAAAEDFLAQSLGVEGEALRELPPVARVAPPVPGPRRPTLDPAPPRMSQARHPAPRVAEFAGGMLNAVGLANPGLVAAREHELPWLAARLKRARVLVNVAGATVADYVEVIAGLADQPVIAAFEINASCPNTSA